MKEKLFSVLGIMALSFAGMFSLGMSTASADYSSSWAKFNTEDGVYEGTVSTSSVDRNVTIHTKEMLRKSYQAGSSYYPAYAHNVKARLCNTSTGACTSYKTFVPNGDSQGGGVVTFSGMKIGKFRIDISDYLYHTYVIGQRSYLVR